MVATACKACDQAVAAAGSGCGCSGGGPTPHAPVLRRGGRTALLPHLSLPMSVLLPTGARTITCCLGWNERASAAPPYRPASFLPSRLIARRPHYSGPTPHPAALPRLLNRPGPNKQHAATRAARTCTRCGQTRCDGPLRALGLPRTPCAAPAREVGGAPAIRERRFSCNQKHTHTHTHHNCRPGLCLGDADPLDSRGATHAARRAGLAGRAAHLCAVPPLPPHPGLCPR
jgi:ribosomal protein S14